MFNAQEQVWKFSLFIRRGKNFFFKTIEIVKKNLWLALLKGTNNIAVWVLCFLDVMSLITCCAVQLFGSYACIVFLQVKLWPLLLHCIYMHHNTFPGPTKHRFVGYECILTKHQNSFWIYIKRSVRRETLSVHMGYVQEYKAFSQKILSTTYSNKAPFILIIIFSIFIFLQ